MAVKLTEEQQKILKGLMYVSGKFADQILHIMKNHGLSAIDGCELTINVNPDFLFSTECVTFGRIDSDAGRIQISKGRRSKDEQFLPVGKNSYEYELLFADEAVRRAMERGKPDEKPLPPDGMWISDNYYDPPVDSWEWD